MSKKIIAGAVLLGAAAAIVPFYLSGYYAAQAMDDYLALTQQSYGHQLQISKATHQSGLYSSTYSFNISVDLTTPDMAPLQQLIGTDQLDLQVDNQLSHGFLSVAIDTAYSGTAKDEFTQFTTKFKPQAKQKDQPLTTLVTQAKFSLSGDYQITSDFTLQGLQLETTDQLGEPLTVSTEPLSLHSLINKKLMSVDGNIGQLTFSKPGDTVSLKQLSFTTTAHLAPQFTAQEAEPAVAATTEPQSSVLGLFNSQNIDLKLASMTIKGPDKEAEMLSQLTWHMDAAMADPRTNLTSALSVAKVGNPTMPMTMLKDVQLDFSFDMGTTGLEKYTKALQSSTANLEDPAFVLAALGHLLAENINFSVSSAKVETFAGLVDITANVDFAALDKATFTANPQAAIASLSYTAEGQVPRDLLMMSAQMQEEVIDNLLEQQMLEEKDEQILFKLSGQSGSVNLNGKPLM